MRGEMAHDLNSAKTVRSVLVIEDDDATRALVGAALTDEGYRVISARDPSEGMRLALECYPALILPTCLCPGGGGMRFLETYLSNGSERAAVVVMTAASEYDRQDVATIADGVWPSRLSPMIFSLSRVDTAGSQHPVLSESRRACSTGSCALCLGRSLPIPLF